jgi:hypothetical protein
MSDPIHPKQVESTPLDAALALTGADKFQKRRRLIKLGASAVPVAITLSSRPARAWDCNSTSAWGSAQISANQSTTARNDKNELANECWTLTNWRDNTSRASLGQPWIQLGCSTDSSKSSYYKKYTLEDLYGAGGRCPDGLTTSDRVWDKLKAGTQATDFQRYLLVAKLNSRLITNVRKCLMSNNVDQLSKMGSGSFQPPNLPNVTWNQSDIIQYLKSNYIATD